MTKKLAGGVLLASMLLPATAFAQDVKIETKWSGINAPKQAPVGNTVIRTEQQARDARIYDMMPIDALIKFDFDKEILLLSVMKPQSTGGYAVDVTKVSRKQTMVILPVPGPSPSPYLEVTVTQTVPGPFDMVTMSPTQPYCLAKIKKTALTPSMITFVTKTATKVTQAFKEISYRRTTQAAVNPFGPGGAPNPHKSTKEVTVHNDGRVVLTRWSTPGLTGIPPVRGTASPQQLAELADAIRQARFHSIPSDLGMNHPAELTRFSFRVIGTPQGDKKLSGVSGHEGQFKMRLQRVSQALMKIERSVDQKPGTKDFDSISLQTQEMLSNSSPFFFKSKTVEIDKDGDVVVKQSSPFAKYAPIKGKATDKEFRQLAQLVGQARLGDNIPSPLDVPLPMWMINNPFTLECKAQSPVNKAKITGQLGTYGQYDARLRPLINMIRKIGERVLKAPNVVFNKITRDIDLYVKRSRRHFEIDSNGNVEIRRAPKPPMLEPAPRTIKGKATKAELETLEKAVLNAKMGVNMPSKLPTPIHILPGNTFTLSVETPVSDTHGATAGELGFYSTYEARLKPLMDAMDAIQTRIELQRPAKSYLEITKNTRTPARISAGQPLRISVQGIASTHMVIDKIETKVNYIETFPETLEITVDAVGRPTPGAAGSASIERPFRKTAVVTGLKAGNWTIVFNTRFLNGSARFTRKLIVGNDLGDEAKGIVDVRGSWGSREVWLNESKSMSYKVEPWSFARTLIKFKGHQVKVSGKVKKTGMFSAEVKAEKLISPIRQDVKGMVNLVNGEPRLRVRGGGIFIPKPTPGLPKPIMPPYWPVQNMHTFGKAAQVLTKADGLRVTVDAFVFKRGAIGGIDEAFIVGVRSIAKENSRLTRWGVRVNGVRKGEKILVIGLNKAGTHVLVEPTTGRTGYMPIDRAELGEKIMPLHSTKPAKPKPGNAGGLVTGVNNGTGQ